MRTRFSFRAVLAAVSFVAFLLGLAQAQERSKWPLAPANVGDDTRMVWGELDNGFRYALLPNTEGERGISIRLIVDAGMVDEPEGKAGVAQFVSHLAFNGASKFGAETLFDLFESSGLSYSSTRVVKNGLLQTVYELDFAKMDEAAFGSVLEFAANVAGGLTFSKADLDRERETASRLLTPGGMSVAEADVARDELIFDGGTYATPSRAELVVSANAMSVEDLTEFWSKNYSSDRMTFFVVGGFNASVLEKKIRSEFGDLIVTNSSERASFRGKSRGKGSITAILRDTKISRATFVSVSEELDFFVAENEKRFWELDAIGRYIQSVADRSGNFRKQGTWSHRGRILLAPYGQGSILAFQRQVQSVDRAGYRVAQQGIAGEELVRLKAGYHSLLLSDYGRLSEREDPKVLADRFAESFATGMPFRYGKNHGNTVRAAVDGLDEARVSELSSEFLNPKRASLIGFLPKGLGITSKGLSKRLKAIRKGYNFNWGVSSGKVSNWDVKRYFGESGLVNSTEIVELGAYHALQYVFSNSLRLNVVRMNGYEGAFSVRLSFGNGLGDVESQISGAARFYQEILQFSSAGDHKKAPQLYETLSGKGLKRVKVEVTQGQSSWSVDGDSDEDLFNFLSLVTEWLITADIREDDFNEAKENALKVTKASDTTTLEELLFGDEMRFKFQHETEELEAVEHQGMRDWLSELASTGYLELTIVGDVEPRKVLRDVRKTLGTREKRTGKVVQPRHGVAARYPEPEIRRAEATVERGRVSMYWPISYENTCSDLFRLRVVEKAFNRYLLQQAKGSAMEKNSIRISSMFDRMIPQSGALRVDMEGSVDSVAAMESALLGWVDAFTASLTQERLEACEKAVQIEFREAQQGRNLLVTLLDQSQGKPASFACEMAIASGRAKYDFAGYIDFLDTMFSVENVRGAVIGE